LSYADKTLTCRDCGQAFTFTRGEQEFYASRGFTNEPGRCPDCRQQRRSSRGDSGGYSSGGYTSGGYSTGGYSSGGYSSGGGYSGGGGGGYGRRELFSAVCSSCGNEARVPVRPRGDKPVYCSDCFSKQGGGGYSSRSSRY
jgi:CxxC-x17-CxxC domain-containing protein